METNDTIHSVENLMGTASVGYMYSLTGMSMAGVGAYLAPSNWCLRRGYSTQTRRDYFMRKGSGSER